MIKTVFEISDGGFSVQKKELEKGDTVIAMSFKKLGGGAYTADITALGGGSSDEEVINYAAATASALTQITRKRPDAVRLWRLFENTLHKYLLQEAEKEMNRSGEEIISEPART